VIRALQDLVSPISAFVRDEYERGPKCEIEVGELFSAWKTWCEDNNLRPGSVQNFGGDLRAVIPELRGFKPHGQKRHYAGIALTQGRNGPNRCSSGSDSDSEPREPHENPLRPSQETNVDLPLIEHCYGCGRRLTWSDEQESGTCSRCWRPAPATEERTSA
jgi:phage/plasmid-associated DNA primase